MTGRESLIPARNSEGQTVAESYRATAAALENEASTFARQAAQKRTAAFGYRRMADEWEAEHLGATWADSQAGDTISLMLTDRYEGLTRERRTVVAVEWPTITLAEGGRVYEIDATQPDSMNRALRIEERR